MGDPKSVCLILIPTSEHRRSWAILPRQHMLLSPDSFSLPMADRRGTEAKVFRSTAAGYYLSINNSIALLLLILPKSCSVNWSPRSLFPTSRRCVPVLMFGTIVCLMPSSLAWHRLRNLYAGIPSRSLRFMSHHHHSHHYLSSHPPIYSNRTSHVP